jgi:hypothetical protein
MLGLAFEFFSTDGERKEEISNCDHCSALETCENKINELGTILKLTCLAILCFFRTFPLTSISRETPMGGTVAVVIVTDSDKAQREESASPQKPNVRIVESSAKDDLSHALLALLTTLGNT